MELQSRAIAIQHTLFKYANTNNKSLTTFNTTVPQLDEGQYNEEGKNDVFISPWLASAKLSLKNIQIEMGGNWEVEIAKYENIFDQALTASQRIKILSANIKD